MGGNIIEMHRIRKKAEMTLSLYLRLILRTETAYNDFFKGKTKKNTF